MQSAQNDVWHIVSIRLLSGVDGTRNKGEVLLLTKIIKITNKETKYKRMRQERWSDGSEINPHLPYQEGKIQNVSNNQESTLIRDVKVSKERQKS